MLRFTRDTDKERNVTMTKAATRNKILYMYYNFIHVAGTNEYKTQGQVHTEINK